MQALTRQPTMRRANTSHQFVNRAGHADEALPGSEVRAADAGEVADPQLVGPIRPEHPVDAVLRASCLGVGHRGAHALAAHRNTPQTQQAQAAHQPLHGAARITPPLE